MKIVSLKPTTYDFLRDYDATHCNLPESTADEWLESETYASGSVLKVSFGNSDDGDREVFDATSGQTVFDFEHTSGSIVVYQSGTKISGFTDTASNMTLLAGAALGTKVEVIKSADTERYAPVRTYQKTSTVTNTYPPDDDLTNWLNLGATNRWKMFDQYVFSSSEAALACVIAATPSSFTVEIDTSNTNYLGLFNLDCSSIEVQYKSAIGTGDVWLDFNPTNFPNIKEIIDYHPHEFQRDTQVWSDYLFGAFVFPSDIIFPIQWDKVSSLRIKFINNTVGSKASCGMCVCGQSYFIGKTQYGASSGILSFSRKTRNDSTGDIYLKKGNNAKTIDIDVKILNEQYNKIHSVLVSADGVPVIIQGNNESTNYEPFMVYCFVKSFDMTLQYATHSECNLEIEGLI